METRRSRRRGNGGGSRLWTLNNDNDVLCYHGNDNRRKRRKEGSSPPKASPPTTTTTTSATTNDKRTARRRRTTTNDINNNNVIIQQDADYELIHSFLPQPQPQQQQQQQQRDYTTNKLNHLIPTPNQKEQSANYLAFASTLNNSNPNNVNVNYQDKTTQCAGVSSAAACIVLELPTMMSTAAATTATTATTATNNNNNSMVVTRGGKRTKHHQLLQQRQHPPPPQQEQSNNSNKNAIILSSNNKRRKSPISLQELTQWRNQKNEMNGINNSQQQVVVCHRFKPVYTHQFFTNEIVRGYKPTQCGVDEALSVASSLAAAAAGAGGQQQGQGQHHHQHHPSFAHHEFAQHTLAIQVRLAPSCRRCLLVLEVGTEQQQQEPQSSQSQPQKSSQQKSKKKKKKKGTIVKRKKQRRGVTIGDSVLSLVSQRGNNDVSTSSLRGNNNSNSNHNSPLRRKVSTGSLSYEAMASSPSSSSWDGDDEDNGEEDDYELQNIHGGGGSGSRSRKRRRGSRRACCSPQQQQQFESTTTTVASAAATASATRGRPRRVCSPYQEQLLQGDKKKKTTTMLALSLESPKIHLAAVPRRSSRRTRGLLGTASSSSSSSSTTTTTLSVMNEFMAAAAAAVPSRQSTRRRSVTIVSENDGGNSSSSAASSSDEDEVQLLSKKEASNTTTTTCCPSFKTNKSTALPSSTTTATATTNTTTDIIHRMKVGNIINQVSACLPEVAVVLLREDQHHSTSTPATNNEGGCYKIISSSCGSTSMIHSTAEIENDYLDNPIGEVYREYSREKTAISFAGRGGIATTTSSSNSVRTNNNSGNNKGEFVLSLADMRTNQNARKYHDEVEKISPWFIEIASCVGLGMNGGVEPDGGYWKVLYLFEKHVKDADDCNTDTGGSSSSSSRSRRASKKKRKKKKKFKYSLVGYVTLFYHGHNMTVCQAVCLPPYQRSGHGTEMLKTAYEVCDGHEILVESPAPAFVALRNRIDYSLVSTLIEKSDLIPREFTEPKQLFTGRDESLPDDILVKVGSKLNITPRQVSTAFDIWKLGELEKAIRDIVAKASTLSGAKVNESIASLEASYKVMLKRSLLKLIRERKDEDDDEVSFGSMSRGEQLDHLEGCFNATIVRYRSILK